MLSLLFILACGDDSETVKVEESTPTENPVKVEDSKESEEVDPIPSKLVEKVEEIEKPSSEESEKTDSSNADKPAIH